jgi:hypothetical protein
MLDTFPICGFHLQPGMFSTRIASTDTSDFRIFVFINDIFYLSLAGNLYCLPRNGFTDLASIPRPLWSLLPPQGENGAEYGLAAAGHDFSYRNTLLVWPAGANPDGSLIPNAANGWVKANLSKPDCDSLLKEMMISGCQVPETIAETIYEAVNLAGGSSYKEDRS